MLSFSRSAQVIVALVAVLGIAASARAQTAVTACGQIVKGDAYLVGDLECPEETENCVLLEGGTLDMAGFTIRGGEYGVFCGKETDEIAPNGEEIYKYLKCTITNGTLADQSVVATVARSLRLTDVTIDYAGEYGLAMVARKQIEFANLTLNLGPGVSGIVVGGGTGKLRGSNLTITGGEVGVSFVRTLDIVGMTASGYTNGAVLSSANVKLSGATLSGGMYGVSADKARIAGSTITGHSVVGVSATQLRVAGSTITGNTLDVRSTKQPQLTETTCGTSNGWGVCAAD